MQNLRGFRIKFIGATDKKPQRLSIKDLRNNKNKIINYNPNQTTKECADAYLRSIGILCIFSSEEDNFYYLFTDNFETELK